MTDTTRRSILLVALVALSGITAGIAGGAGSDSPAVSVSDTRVKAGAEASVGVSLDAVPNGLRKYNVTLTLADAGVADIEEVQAGDVTGSSFDVVAQSADAVTFQGVDLTGAAVGPNDGPVDLGTVVLTNTTDGSTDVEVTIHALTDDDGSAIDAAVEPGTLTVTDVASVTIDDQRSFGDAVTVDEAFLPDGGYLVVHDRAADGSLGAALGHSSYLAAGTHADATVNLTTAPEASGTLVAAARTDDGDRTYEAGADEAYTDAAGDPITDDATVELHYGPRTLVDGASVWRGQSLYRADGVDAGSTVTVRAADNTSLARVADDDGDGAVIVTTADRRGDYVLEAADGAVLANFTVTDQAFDASFGADTVSNAGNDTAVDLSLASNRTSYAVELRADGLNASQLASIVDAAEVHDGVAVVTGVGTGTDVTADFDGVAAGNYTVTANVTDAAVDASAAITVEAPGTTTVDVVLDGAPNGLYLYNVTVTGPEGTAIESVEPELITSGFEEVDGGPGSSSVTARAVELFGIDAFEESKVLLTVEFEGDLTADEVSVTVNQLVDADQGDIPTDRVSLDVTPAGGSEPVFTAPLPGSGGDGPPADLDGDGLYEDVNGDGVANFDDAIAMAFADDRGLTTRQLAAIDFNGDGEVTFGDAIELAFSI